VVEADRWSRTAAWAAFRNPRLVGWSDLAAFDFLIVAMTYSPKVVDGWLKRLGGNQVGTAAAI
jgi:hypothetical protein